MEKSILIVTHGMGDHDAQSLKKTVVDAANLSLNRYPTIKARLQQENKAFEDYVDVVPIEYNNIFEEERQRLVEANKPVSDYFRTVANADLRFVKELVKLEGKLADDNFYTTHLADVLFYASLLCERVRVQMLKVLVEVLSGRGNRDVHILAHSLGTAAMHDTLEKAFTGGIIDQNTGRRYALDPTRDKIDSLWMVANISNLLFELNPIRTGFDPYNSRVKPSGTGTGAIRYFYNVYHRFDPFTLFKRFEPELEDNWVAADDFEEIYREIRTKDLFTSKNPHDLGGYLSDPLVADPFLRRVMPSGTFSPPREEARQVRDSVVGAFAKIDQIGDHVKEIDSVEDFSAFIKMLKDFKTFIDDL
ncbi:hypothetical protein [Grimontia marina]|uniref:Alpha/beta hydrolase family protein n=1 Tax=Grimontia marina TaxID=646534 RepID=A0A128ET23_9GAMM|nr:hypothetical protein [Grimontia marina]CZF77350.1 hypothetical protein GMA8713_00129 [Grimontia marina]